MGVMDMIMEKWSPPTKPEASFTDKVVLVTGANTGLGFEFAKLIASLQAKKLIITTRSSSKGDTAKQQISEWLIETKSAQSTEIIPLVLDMTSAEGVKTFHTQLLQATDHLDYAVLNAGVNSPPHIITKDGYEETIQVNTASTIFLATLLCPLLVSTSKSTKTQTHLTFVSSRNATEPASFPEMESIQNSKTPLKASSERNTYPAGAMGGQVQYGRSKLYLEYAMRRLVQLPALQDENQKPYVIIDSVCPGATKTDLARNYEGVAMKMVVKVFLAVVAKPASEGATVYLQALCQTEEAMGRMWIAGRFVDEWQSLTSEGGRKLGDSVWNELKTEMVGWDSGLGSFLGAV